MDAEAEHADHPGHSEVTGAPCEPTLAAARTLSRVVLAGGMGAAGYVHLASADSFLPMMPDWVPARIPIVWVTGVIELGLAFGLLAAPARYRRQVGWALAVFLVVIFPANIYQAIAGTTAFGMETAGARWFRLLFQPLLVLWALWATDAWPRRSQRHEPSTNQTARP